MADRITSLIDCHLSILIHGITLFFYLKKHKERKERCCFDKRACWPWGEGGGVRGGWREWRTVCDGGKHTLVSERWQF